MFSAGLLSYTNHPCCITNPLFVAEKLREDMADIQLNYMDKEMCNFWVAELEGQILGCVGAIVSKDFPGT